MTVKFLFMDERYADHDAPKSAKATSLTGVLTPADTHGAIRERFYGLIREAVGSSGRLIVPLPKIHASNLLPEADDETRFSFLEGLVRLINDFELRIYRIGYLHSPQSFRVVKHEIGLLGLCFQSMLHCIETELVESAVWPVMEVDASNPKHDQSFAGLVQELDYITANLGSSSMSINNHNLGEVLYTTKRSAHGAIVDCIAYLLHARFLKLSKCDLTAFKERLATIASGLSLAVCFDEIIELQIGRPPRGYVPTGPLRFAFPITPKD